MPKPAPQKPFNDRGDEAGHPMLGRADYDVVTFGEAMLLLEPEEAGPLEEAATFRAGIGGAEANCAIGLARLGHSVAWVSRVGRDPFGRKVLKRLRGEGVDVGRVEVSPDEPTGLMLKEPNALASPRVYYYRTTSAAKQLHDALFDGLYGRLLFATGITAALSPQNHALTLSLAERFRREGALVVYDPNMRHKLWTVERAREAMLLAIQHVDVLLPSLAEAEMLTGLRKVDDIAKALLDLGPSRVAVKMGNQGTFYADANDRGLVPPCQVPEVDPVGAGDAFCAGLISGLLEGLPFFRAVKRGAATGALSVTCRGDHTSPHREELEMFEAGQAHPTR